jgi:hypothetical protein
VLFTLAVLIAGCNRPAPPPPPNEHVEQPAMDDEAIERLRSLGYLGTSGLPKKGAGRGAVILDRDRMAPGPTLVVFSGSCEAQLLSPEGQVVRSWMDQSCHRWDHAELLPDGGVAVVGARLDEDRAEDPIRTGRYLMRLTSGGKVVWRLEINAHHDVSITPDGKLLTLVMKRRRVPEIDPVNDIADDELTLVSMDGAILESVSLYDILAAATPPYAFQKAGAHDAGRSHLLDPFHSNAIRSASVPAMAARHPIYGPGTVIVTSRHQDDLFVIDWTARKLLWHWGRGIVSGPHDASMLRDGHVLVFDNGLARGASRVLELDPLDPAALRQFAPGGSKFFDRVMGSCQRLPNGNTLIVHSEGGSAVELSPEGAPVWTYEGTLATPEGYRVKIIRMRRVPS